MFNLLQTLQDKRTGKLVLYLGVRGDHMIGKREDGRIVKDKTGRRWKEIRDEKGRILIGKEVDKWEVYGYYFGCVKQSLWDKMEPDMSLKKYVKEAKNASGKTNK